MEARADRALPAGSAPADPAGIPDDWFNRLFAALPSDRDRALVAFWISTGARGAELLGMRQCDIYPASS